MNQTIDIVNSAIAHPPKEIANLMNNNSILNGGLVKNGGMGAKLQVVDENQDFTQDLNSHMIDWKLLDSGFNYDVVAVFGSQSTGKSTLLNRLFGTKFDVMNESERRQTTKGIWMSKGAEMNVLVMDVEGTDGRERGEDQDFERKSALFSIAVSEILLVNIWEHQVGLYQGANMGLLKTVFEVNLALFLSAKQKGKVEGGMQTKTLLLFVIRDHIGATPLANLKATLLADLNRLWNGLSKPIGLEFCEITTFFDLEFVTLPHKLLQPDLFEKEILNLRQRFVGKGEEGYLFKEEYHKRIPADGIGKYMSTIWDAVVSNKDLDLPTQQELLAQFRCDEIANSTFVDFLESSKSFNTSVVVGKIVVGLGKLMGEVRTVALVSFDVAASRYHTAVYQRKRLELLAKLNATLLPYYQTQLKNLSKSILKQFRIAVQTELKVDGYNFKSVMEEHSKSAQSDFLIGAKEVKLSESDWEYEAEFDGLKEDILSIADLLKVEEIKKMILIIERNIKKDSSETVELALDSPEVEMWDKVLIAFKAALAKGESEYTKKAASFNSTSEENSTALIKLRKNAWLGLRSKIDEQTIESVLLVKLKLLFEEKFRYDDIGVPRVWKPTDDVDGIFKKAKDSVLSFIPLYATISPSNSANSFELPSSVDHTDLNHPNFDFLSTLSILSPTSTKSLSDRFKRESDTYYLEVKRSMISSISQIPLWIYGVLILLGWNEFIAVLRSPLYFMMLLVLGGGAYVVLQLNMGGPVIAVAKSITTETLKTVNEQIHNYFAAQAQNNNRVLERPHSVPISKDVSEEGSGIELDERRKVD